MSILAIETYDLFFVGVLVVVPVPMLLILRGKDEFYI